MSRSAKLLTKLLSKPKTFTYDELRSVLTALGFEEKQGSGSRVKFFNPKTKVIINLHKPHPGNELKKYAINNVVEILKEHGYT